MDVVDCCQVPNDDEAIVLDLESNPIPSSNVVVLACYQLPQYMYGTDVWLRSAILILLH